MNRDNKIICIRPRCENPENEDRLVEAINYALEGVSVEYITTAQELDEANLRKKRILFAINLGDSGINLEYYRMLKIIRLKRHKFDGSVGGAVVDGHSELFTKSFSRQLVFSANRSGCTFVGRPLVEGTETMLNFNVVSKIMHTEKMDAYKQSCRELVEKLLAYEDIKVQRPKILAINASTSEKYSNTLLLWNMIKKNLEDCDVMDISIRDGEIWDCRGCSYETCLHFGENQQCFYGGVITDQVYPSIMECDALVMLCPNYNDAVSANLTACINRLTSLYRVADFSAKKLFAVIVSGYSGSDIVAQQLISALNMNKSFVLPPRFAIMETANNPQSIKRVQGINENASEFAHNMMKSLIEDYD